MPMHVWLASNVALKREAFGCQRVEANVGSYETYVLFNADGKHSSG